jgi:hypothetical protein
MFGVYEFGNCFAGILVEVGCFQRQGVDGPVNVAVVVFVEVGYRVDDLVGFLGGCGVVKVD